MSRAWIAFYMGDYQKKTQHLDTLQHGAYFLLLQHCWTNETLPAEPASRAAIARMTLPAWKKIAPVINPFFDEEGKNKRASEEIEKAEIIRTRRAISGQRGGFASGISKAIASGKRSKSVAKSQQITEQIPQQKTTNCEAIHNHIDKSTTSPSVERGLGNGTITPELAAILAKKATA